jgi:hypothetical protein
MMHKDFPQWHRDAGIEPVAITIPLWWTGVEEFDPKEGDMVTLTKFFFGLERPNEAFLETFRKPFQAADITFPMQNNDEELRVLAGAKLVDVIERGSAKLAMVAALCLVSASFQNLRKGARVPAIPGIAASHLNSLTVNRAKAPDEPSDLCTALTAVGEPYDQLADEFAQVQRELAVVSEESNMLWWLFSETSRDLNKQWSVLTLPAAAIIAGKELADLTRLLPGPLAAAAFLSKIIRFAKAKLPATIAIKEAINDSPLDWRQKHVGTTWESELDAVIPLHAGIKKSIGSPEKETWVPAFITATGVATGAKLPPDLLSYQMFIEGMLIRAWLACKADA